MAAYLHLPWFRCLSFVQTWLIVTRNKIKGRQDREGDKMNGPAAAATAPSPPTKWQNALASERVTEETSVLTGRISVLQRAVKASELVSAAATHTIHGREWRLRRTRGGEALKWATETQSTYTNGVTRMLATADCAICNRWRTNDSFGSSRHAQFTPPPASEFSMSIFSTQRQRQVWFIPLRINAGGAGKTVRSLENACHTWAPSRCVHDEALYRSTFTFTTKRRVEWFLLTSVCISVCKYDNFRKPWRSLVCGDASRGCGSSSHMKVIWSRYRSQQHSAKFPIPSRRNFNGQYLWFYRVGQKTGPF